MLRKEMTDEMTQEMFGMSLKSFREFLSLAQETANLTQVPKHLVTLLAKAPGTVEEKLLLMFLTATGIACTGMLEMLKSDQPKTVGTVN